jgi:hypothetical protein
MRGHKYDQHNSTAVTIRIPNSTLASISAYAARRGVPRSVVIREWLTASASQDRNYLKSSGSEPRNSGPEG